MLFTSTACKGLNNDAWKFFRRAIPCALATTPRRRVRGPYKNIAIKCGREIFFSLAPMFPSISFIAYSDSNRSIKLLRDGVEVFPAFTSTGITPPSFSIMNSISIWEFSVL